MQNFLDGLTKTIAFSDIGRGERRVHERSPLSLTTCEASCSSLKNDHRLSFLKRKLLFLAVTFFRKGFIRKTIN